MKEIVDGPNAGIVFCEECEFEGLEELLKYEIEDNQTKNYENIDFGLGVSIEDAVNQLLDLKAKGTLACGVFNGVRLESDTVTMDSAYIAITGKAKSEWDLA